GRERDDEVIDKELVIAITAEGGFSGDIDKKLVDELIRNYDKNKQDVVVIGHHGAVQLARAGVSFKRYFKLPETDNNINVKPLVNLVRQYRSAAVYYQNYISLLSQDIKKIELHEAVTEAGKRVGNGKDVIDESTYIFEPSSFAVIAHLERSMMEISLGQTIFDSKLAQNASRFRAMSEARDKSKDTLDGFQLEYNHAIRARSDERLKEIINGMKVAS
ncbi:MAG: F0F1 ATP synthase subunit gamma, partial [Candidatus Saccharimonadales bacterium]